MSNIAYIREEKAANIGNFLVGRLLPFREKRAVGPFVFIDHMGPAQLKDSENLDVPPHPHIGLSTLTYLFEGAIFHRDSIGSAIEIQPGAVNWMTAGKGVVHSERTPEYLRTSEKNLHGLQIWIALPKELEDCEPYFHHSEASSIPTWKNDEVSYKLVAGAVLGHKSPVPVHSNLYFLEIKNTQETRIDLSGKLFGESAIYILKGGVESEGNEFEPKQFLVAKHADLCAFTLKENSIIYIFGGDAFPEERFIEWNFVHSDKRKIEQAKLDWKNQLFPKVPGETTFVPLPEPRKMI